MIYPSKCHFFLTFALIYIILKKVKHILYESVSFNMIHFPYLLYAKKGVRKMNVMLNEAMMT